MNYFASDSTLARPQSVYAIHGTGKRRHQLLFMLKSMFAHRARSPLSAAWLALCLAFGLAAVPAAAFAQVLETYYVPLPEEDIHTMFNDLTNNTVSTDMVSTVSISVARDGTVINWDHWEATANDRVWGDGDITNGCLVDNNGRLEPEPPPAEGGSCNLTDGDPPLSAGDVIVVRNTVPVTGTIGVQLFNGGDSFTSNFPLAVTRSMWATNPATLLAGAAEVYPVEEWGTSFSVPGGQDSNLFGVSCTNGDDTADYCMFQDTRLSIMAATDLTVVTVDTDRDGVAECTQTLDAGETLLVDNSPTPTWPNGFVCAEAVNESTLVTATEPVQVHVLTGDIGANYETRWFHLLPTADWGNEYLAPAYTTNTAADAIVVLYNDDTTNLTVAVTTQAGTTNVIVPARGLFKYTMPTTGGALFASTDQRAFMAFGVMHDEGPVNDWGYPVQPTDELTPLVKVGWAPQSDDSAFPTISDEAGAPVWVTAAATTWICVDFEDDDVVDQVAEITPFQVLRIVDDTPGTGQDDNEMTGARIFSSSDGTCTGPDGEDIAVAWGQDPSVASPASPAIDVGTTVGNFAAIFIDKTSQLFIDQDGDGFLEEGDTLEYTLTVYNPLFGDAENVIVTDTRDLSSSILDSNVTYVDGSTTISNPSGSIPDDASGSAFPLDGAGYNIGTLPGRTTRVITFYVTVKVGTPDGTEILNTASVESSAGAYQDDDIVEVTGEGNLIEGTVFLDSTDGDGLYDPGEFGWPSVTVYLCTGDVTTCDSNSATFIESTTTNANGEYSFATELDGDFTVQIDEGDLPSGYELTSTNDININFVGVGNTSSQNDFGFELPLSITKASNVSGDVSPGDTITYTLTVANNSGVPQSNIEVKDVLPAGVTYVANSTVAVGPFDNSVSATDDFSSGNFSGGSGWTGSFWSVVNTPIVQGGEALFNSNTGSSGDAIYRSVDLSGVDSATASFNVRETGFIDSTDTATVEICADTTFANCQVLFSQSDDFGSFTVTNEPIDSDKLTAAATFRVRVDGYQSNSSELFYIDNIVITGGGAALTTKDNVIAGTNPDLLNGEPPNLVIAGDQFVLQPAAVFAWTESGDDGSSSGGEIRIDSEQLEFFGNTGGSSGTITREIDLDGATGATLSFDWFCSTTEGFEVEDDVYLQISTDGTTYVDYYHLQGEFTTGGADAAMCPSNFTSTGSGSAVVSIPGSTTHVRFSKTLSRSDEIVNIDNISIVATGSSVTATDDFSSGDYTGGSGWSTPGSDSTLTVTFDVTVDDPLANGITQLLNVATAESDETATPVTAQNSEAINPGAILGDRVYYDTDGDGVEDIGEEGIPGVTVQLYLDSDGDGDPATGTQTLLESTETDENGNYLFDGIYPDSGGGSYYTQVMPGTLPPNIVATDGNTGTSDDVSPTGTAGEEFLDLDFGYVPNSGLGSVGDTVWSDADGDGIQDPGEAGIEGLVMALVSDPGADGIYGTSDDVVAATTTTDAAGSYLFTDVTPGEYVVVADVGVDGLPASGDETLATAGYTPTSGPQSEGDETSAPFTVLADIAKTDVDFGYNNPGLFSISDEVWFDADGDGIRDTSEAEPGLAGVTIDLYSDPDGIPGNGDEELVATTVTGSDGSFSFDGLENGDYEIVVTDTNGVLNGTGGTTTAAQVGDHGELPVTIDGADVSNISFGYNAPGTIGDRIWSDADGDGVQDEGEAGIAGVVVNLLDSSGTILETTTTAADGSYLFSGREPSNYTVEVDASNFVSGGVLYDPLTSLGYPQTGDPEGDNDDESTFTLSPGTSDLTRDFGYQQTSLADISGNVFEDLDRQGDLDGGEPLVEGVTVALYDAGPDGILGTADDGGLVTTTVTASDGSYSFPDLPPGNYTVKVTDDDGVLDGYELSSGLDEINVALAATDVTDINFGYVRESGTGSIGDFVWLDADGDGFPSSSETGLPGVSLTLYADRNNDGLADTTVNVVANKLDLNSDGVIDALDTGVYYGVAVYDGLLDLNGDGQITTDDDGSVNGYEVLNGLIDSDGATTIDGAWDTAVTDTDGGYLFTELPAGIYSVEVDGTTVPANLADTTGTSKTIALSDGEANLDADFGYEPADGYAVLGDRVWYDTDGNGIQDVGEVGIGGVTIQIIDENGEVIEEVVTNPDGTWLATIPEDGTPSQYGVTVVDSTLPGGIVQTPTNLGGGDTWVFTAQAGDMLLNLDFGYEGGEGASIGDEVFIDYNGDGDRDDGEGLSGVKMTISSIEIINGLVDLNGDGEITVADTCDITLNTCNGYGGFSVTNGVLDASAIGSVLNGYTVVSNDAGGAGLDINGNGAIDDNDDLADQILGFTRTDADGRYLFDNLLPGDYRIDVGVESTLPSDLTQTVNDAGTVGEAWSGVITVTEGGSDLTADFGYQTDPALAVIGDRIWSDANGDGVQDEGEVGLGGAIIYLCPASVDPCNANNAVQTTTSSSDGSYLFTGVPPGAYTVAVEPNSVSGSNTGFPTGTVNGEYDLTVAAGDMVDDVDFGYNDDVNAEGSIGDTVYHDNGAGTGTAGDGIQNGDEPGIAGVTVSLYTAGRDGVLGTSDDLVVATTTTDSLGNYSFDGLPPGEYQAVVTDIDGVLSAAGLTQQTQTAPSTLLITCSGAENGCDNLDTGDFGYIGAVTGSGSIGDTLYFDSDGNGCFDDGADAGSDPCSAEGGEVGIPGVTLELVDVGPDGVLGGGDDTLAGTTTTGPNGYYQFDGLLEGDYQVVVTDTANVLADLTATETAGIKTITCSGDTCDSFDDADFGYKSTTGDIGALGGTVWHDTDKTSADGVLDPLDPGIEGATVELWLDTNNDGNIEPGVDNLVRTATTDENGDYLFLGLPPANYIVNVVEDEGPLTGMRTLLGPEADRDLDNNGHTDPYPVSLGLGEVNTTVDFAYEAVSPSSISGTVFEDSGDSKGTWDDPTAGGDDAAVVGASVALYVLVDGIEYLIGTTVTDANGDYSFGDLPEGGTYVVKVDVTGTDAESWEQTVDPETAGSECTVCDSQTTVINLTTPVTDLNFGYWNGDVVTTPVTLAYFEATAGENPGEVHFNWATATETGNVGFDLYVVNGDEWLRINENIVPAAEGGPVDRREYRYFAKGVEGATFYIVDLDIFAKDTAHGPFELNRAYGLKEAVPNRIERKAINDERKAKQQLRKERKKEKMKEKLRKQKNKLKDQGDWSSSTYQAEPHWAARLAGGVLSLLVGTAQAAELPVLDTGLLRIEVSQSGIHRITYEQLADAGLGELNGAKPDWLSLTNRGEPVPLTVAIDGAGNQKKFGPGWYLEFVGEGLDSLYTRTNVYQLYLDRKSAARVTPDPRTVPENGTAAGYYLETVRVEDELLWEANSPTDDPWIMERVWAFSSLVKNYPITVDDYAGPVAPVTLGTSVWGFTDFPEADNDHHLLVDFNGVNLADEWFDGVTSNEVSVEVPAGDLQEGVNTVTLRLPMDTGNQWDLMSLDHYQVTYPRRFVSRDGRGLSFSGSADHFTVEGLSSADLVVYRVDADGRVFSQDAIDVVEQTDGSFHATFAGTGQEADYYLATLDGLAAPGLEPPVEDADITSMQASYLIIAHPDFIGTGANDDPLGDLKLEREADGYSVFIADLEQVYARFGFGIVDPLAIKDYIAHAQQNMGTQMVLLVGGDTLDYFGYLDYDVDGDGNPIYDAVSFVPSLYAQTGPMVFHAPVDPLFTDTNGDNLPDLAIGRFPVRTSFELRQIVDKTLAWRYRDYGRSSLFVADKEDTGNNYNFTADSDDMITRLPGNWQDGLSTAYSDELGPAATRSATLEAINDGVALTSYVGHSGPSYWSFDFILQGTDAAALTNHMRPTILTQWGCWNTFYVSEKEDTMGHEFLLNGDQGAAAVLGASTLTDATHERRLAKELYDRLFQPGLAMGEAIRLAKENYAATSPTHLDVLLGWTLLGDPALVMEP